jgi:hypothetical protein
MGGTWRGTVAEHDCAGLLLVDAYPTLGGRAMFVPWDKVMWVEFVECPECGEQAA